ncbi:unnamed protein product [Triticum turgidum subsp. durum]|uniref:DUF6598 domain-containing protein n=1 Tax=Triticum turgidum subsp. durum TaxID=4567 RepID=A0A9R0PZA1_TRITD|nr:unnamed protein product [Triticum turgidum subsp. durum]
MTVRIGMPGRRRRWRGAGGRKRRRRGGRRRTGGDARHTMRSWTPSSNMIPRSSATSTPDASVPPMRYTDSIYQDEFGLEDSANILSVSIVSSDVGFPVNVYGRVIARDSIDYKCIYLFHCNRDDCQHLNKDGMLILTGPYRGLVLVDFIYLEIDLKIREEGVFPDRPFSKGLISIDGRVLSREKDVVVRSETLESWLSTTEVRFTTVLNAVECTFEIKLIEGLFKGNIIVGIADKARKLDIEQTIVIHDSTADGVVTSDESGLIKLRRSVITICLERNVMFRINNEAAGVCAERTSDFTPCRTGADEEKITCGAGKFRFRVVWSLMDFRL